MEDINLNSHVQVKSYLLSIGWKPTEWNYKRLPDGAMKKMSPKLTEDSYDSLERSEIGVMLKEYFITGHRRNTLENIKEPYNKGLLSMIRDDGRVTAKARTLGTPTSRYKHSGAVCNVAAPGAMYGKEMRTVFKVPKGSHLIGVDLSGIEARVLTHYCYKYDGGPQFAELVLEGDFHSSNAELWNVSRKVAKSILYALMYGAGAEKLGAIAGRSKYEGEKIKKAFLNMYPPYSLLLEDLKKNFKVNNYIKAIDGRKIMIRQEYRLLNSLIQSTSAVIFKKWMVMCHEWMPLLKQVAAVHDELQIEYSGTRAGAEEVGSKMVALISEVGKFFNLNVDITGEAKIGNNWYETH